MPSPGQHVTLARHAYRLVRPIGTSSSYGNVWQAIRQRSASEQEVALKFVNEQLLRDATPEQLERWRRAAEAERSFLEQISPWDGRHIVRLLDSGESHGFPVLALELMPTDLSQTLARARRAGQSLPADLTLSWLQQVNHALARVHDRGWRYLDLKPANLLLDSTRTRLKLADFGSNRSFAADPEHSFVGTPGWQAPEQVIDAGGEGQSGLRFSTDARADYFALGMLFYTLVTTGETLRFGTRCKAAVADGLGSSDVRVDANLTADSRWALHPEEEELFARCFTASLRARAAREATWYAAPPDPMRARPAATESALSLLRSLVAWSPDDRPMHEGQISREIFHIRKAIETQSAPAEDVPPNTATDAPRPRSLVGNGQQLATDITHSIRVAAPWLVTAVVTLLIVLLGLLPAYAQANASVRTAGEIDLPRCENLVVGDGASAIRIGIVEPSTGSLLEYAAALAARHENLHLCAKTWAEILPRYTPWAKVTALEKGHGWLIFGLGLLVTLVLCAWLTPQSWWRSGPTLVGWTALGLGTVIVSSTLMAAFIDSAWARGLFFSQPVSVQIGRGTPQWVEIAGAYDLHRLLVDKPLMPGLAPGPELDEAAGPAGKSDRSQASRTDLCCTRPTAGTPYRAHQALNLRSGPGVQFDRLRTLQVGDQVRPTGTTRGDWWEVGVEGNDVPATGWVSSLWLRQAGPPKPGH